MKLTVVALDYDGTTAHEGSLHPEVQGAVETLRRAGIAVLMVTGRRIDHLRQELDPRLFDAVVAENGAVILYPESGRHTIMGRPPSASFVQALYDRGIDVIPGQCLVEAPAHDAAVVLETIREQQLPLVILFNRSRLMVLPQAISKATGLREALRVLGLSPHNAVALGDAENDHELLSAVEVGVAVGWGSPALKEIADEIVNGSSPGAVAAYLRKLAVDRCVPPASTRRRRLLLGSTENGERFELIADGRNILIAGRPKSGKSWLAGLLCEQLVLMGYSVCVIDPEGDYTGLLEFPAVLPFGGDNPLPLIRDLVHALIDPSVSVVLNLSKMSHEQKLEYVPELLRATNAVRRETGVPHWVLLDEAHYFLSTPESASLIESKLAGYMIVTYQVSQICNAVLQSSEAILVTNEIDPREVETLRKLRAVEGSGSHWDEVLGELEIAEAALLPGATEAAGRLCRFRIAPRLTYHVRHRTKYIDVPVDDRRAFFFAEPQTREGLRARSLHEFSAALARLPVESIDGHLRGHDFSSWIREVFGDRALAERLRELETRYVLEPYAGVNEEIGTAIRERYGS
jgi:hydroxymethylpyrimidine pyrophosphatase-like HAD family hydrolase